MASTFVSGAAVEDISPRTPQSLFGYPHVPRRSTGIHDPLLSSALYAADGRCEAMFIASDIIYVSKAMCARARKRIEEATGIPGAHIMITASHTHSGPSTVDVVGMSRDTVVPAADPDYVRFAEDGMVRAATRAYRNAQPARMGLGIAHFRRQTNRHDPDGPVNPEIPVLSVQDACSGAPVACMLVGSIHPTVLHADSTLVSADFPGAVRAYLQQTVLGGDCPVLYHSGPCGNQSPRYLVSAKNFAAMDKLGREIGEAVALALPTIEHRADISVAAERVHTELTRRQMPSVAEAQQALDRSVARLRDLREAGAAREVVRTAECDWFGAEEALTLARASQEGWLASAYEACLPCEIQAIGLGPWIFVGWPGEIFVEYALAVREAHENVYAVSMANGELQGYIVTEGAARQERYEALNSIFDYRSGESLLRETRLLIERLRREHPDATPSLREAKRDRAMLS